MVFENARVNAPKMTFNRAALKLKLKLKLITTLDFLRGKKVLYGDSGGGGGVRRACEGNFFHLQKGLNGLAHVLRRGIMLQCHASNIA